MLEGVTRWAGAQWWRVSGRVERDRAELYGGATGLRAVTFHETSLKDLDQVRRVVDWCRGRFEMATPAEADGLFEGRWRPGQVDRMLITFDDGLASNYQAARWLAEAGVQAIFFIVPSLIDRTMAEYLRYHAGRGVQAHPPLAASDTRGLTTSQVKEMMAMGHRIGAHNFAHRDLGPLHSPADLHYEVDQALDAVGALTGQACRDFAIGFGQPENLSDEAAAHLLERCPHVYACHRGLNVPGLTSRFVLRHAFYAEHPMAFTRICLEGGADRRLADRAREMVRRVGVLPAVAGACPR
jgi:peptidoglycan/xylan/chitin deacetylase (PgdA/CDA1 family)